MKNNGKTPEMEKRSENSETHVPPEMTTPATDSDMMDVTRQENRTSDFEAQLREIDCAILAVDTVKEKMGNREPKKENRADTGSFYSDQPEAIRNGGKEGKSIKGQSLYAGPLTDSDGPFECARNQQEAQKTQSHMDPKTFEGGRVLRSKACDTIQKTHIHDTVPKNENKRQETSTSRKSPEKKKTPEYRGKENEPHLEGRTPQGQEVQGGVIQGTWKRYRRDGEDAASFTVAGPETGSKRKGTMPLKEVQEGAESGKRSKKEEEVVLGIVGQQWRVTGFYGNPETSKRQDSWLLLKQLSTLNSLPWVCLGDFNELMNGSEKEGGSARPVKQMEAFCEVINSSCLRDMGYKGQDYTWSRRMGNRGWVRERLDRALVSTNWTARFPQMQLHHKPNSASDHCVLVLKDVQNSRKKRRRKKLFRFEEMWLKDESCVGVIEDAWDRGSNRRHCKPALRNWNARGGHLPS
nr:hypothetical protein CFP56_76297 [Quercus suber]